MRRMFSVAFLSVLLIALPSAFAQRGGHAGGRDTVGGSIGHSFGGGFSGSGFAGRSSGVRFAQLCHGSTIHFDGAGTQLRVGLSLSVLAE